MIVQYADQFMLASKNFAQVGSIGWIIVGGLAGWIASKVMGTDRQMGIFLNIVVGIIGGWLGGILARAIFHADTQSFGKILTFVIAFVGACILLFIVKLVTGRK
jgi:uncharacterized membrane protein YeaQ/YmgE (transglycosylase-associated protein family)